MRYLYFIVILLPLLVKGQQNLIPNPSFEEMVLCPTSPAQIQLATPWVNDAGGVDLYAMCSTVPIQGVPENVAGYQHPHSGESYAGIYTYGGILESEGREYLQVQLANPVKRNVGYVVSFRASLADNYQYAIGSIGAYLSDTLIVREQYNSVLEVEPSIQSASGIIMSDKNIWYHITDTFTSRFGGEQYLLIGNFKSTAESDTLLVPTGANNRFQSYYYIDDVSVIALDDTVSSIEEAERLQFNVYPNPNNGRFEIRASESLRQHAAFIMYDTQGRAVLRQQMQKGMSSTTVNTEHLAKGVYTLRLLSDDGSSGWEMVVVQ